MKLGLFGKNSKDIEPLIKNLGLEIATENPDVILSYGGDGTLLSAEREFPGIPKLPIRNSAVCKKCSEHEEEVLLKKLKDGQLKLKEYKKLQTNVYGTDLYALNDFVIRNQEPMHAVRFEVLFPSDVPSDLFIGDGIVVSTPYGSSGYFKSVTKETFKDGFALALNNATEEKNEIWMVDQDEQDKKDDFDEIGFKLIRGNAHLSFDNSPDTFQISEGTILKFKLSDKVAKIYELESLRCPDCIVARG